jgi:hypothetical protein
LLSYLGVELSQAAISAERRGAMVTKKRTVGQAKEKLKLKKETIKDLQPRRASVKGGIRGTVTVITCVSKGCPPPPL